MCGLFGIVSSSPRTLDLRAFCTLGVMNDSRGGDSCGISLDGNIEYGFGKESALFIDFMRVSKTLFKRNRIKVALGHCRKASVGGVTLEKAQPVKVFDKDGNLSMIVIHNGTIHNYQDLADRYLPGEDISDLSDSQVMARIFQKGHYSVLKEYRGGGAFVIHDLKKNTVYLFKGASKSTDYAKEITEERPLFCCYDKDAFIFSSLAYPLVGLYPKNKIYRIPCNTLYKVHNGRLVKLEVLDRSECLQSKPTVVTVNSYSGFYQDRYIDFNVKTGRYKLGKNYLTGEQFFSDYGYHYDIKSQWANSYWFWGGYMLPGQKSYEAVLKYSTECKDPQKALQLAKALTYLPFDEKGCWMESYEDGSFHVVKDNKVSFPLSRNELHIKNGRAVMTSYLSTMDATVFNDLSDDMIQKIVNNVCRK